MVGVLELLPETWSIPLCPRPLNMVHTVHGKVDNRGTVLVYPCTGTGGSHGERTCGACIGGARNAFAATRKISSA